MPVEVLMPKLGLTMTEGKIVEWKKNEGNSVSKGDVLFVLETEKVAYEVEAKEEGTLGAILVQEDETVPVGTLVAYLLAKGESLDSIPKVSTKQKTEKDLEPRKPSKNEQAPAGTLPMASTLGGRVRVTPLAKKMARELGLDLHGVRGTGPSGRIVADDIKNATSGKKQTTSHATPSYEAEDRLVPFDGMRKTIAANMMAAKLETAQTYMSLTVDATQVVERRKSLLPYIEEKFSARLSITDLLMKLVGHGIAQHPIINTRWTNEGIVYLRDVHMGMAMSLPNGLAVPVIKDINKKGLGEIARDRLDLIKKMKERKYLPDDIKGSTFTLSTLGMFEIESFTANINRPESAILAVGAILDKAVAHHGEVVIRPMMNITLTYDHRIIDGAEAAKFMGTLKSLIEEPLKLLV